MNDAPHQVTCSTCGKEHPRSEMFGIEPDLTCPDCAQGIRSRMQVRTRPAFKTHPPIVMGACIALCAVFFVAYQAMGKVEGGGLAPWVTPLMQWVEIWSGEWWRHLTVVFMHFSLMHIAMNLMSTWSIGRILEAYWGPWITLGVVLLTGIAASAIGWMASGSGIGFSGALFGVCGFLWGQRGHHPVANQVMNLRMRKWIITMMVVFGVLTMTGSLNIGNWAHGGGLVSGWLLGQAWAPARRKWAIPAMVALVVGVVVAAQFFVFGDLDGRKLVAPGGKTIETRAELRELYLEELELERKAD